MNNNKLIAEFMGYIKYSEQHHGLYCEETGELGEFKNLQYHTSWDWLVPVLIKIERECQGVPPQLLDVGFYVEIDEVYQAVVEFIKVYNDE